MLTIIIWNSFPQPPEHLFLTYLLYKISIIFGDCSSALPPRILCPSNHFHSFPHPRFLSDCSDLDTHSNNYSYLTTLCEVQPHGLYAIRAYYLTAIKEPSCVSTSPTLFPGLQKAEYHSAFQRYACPILQDIPCCFGNYCPLNPLECSWHVSFLDFF